MFDGELKKMTSITILITAVGTQSMPGLADCFHNNGERTVKIVGADMSNDYTICQMVDVFYQVPKVYEESYVDALLDICKKEKVNIFFPFMDEELELIDDRLSDFQNIGVIVSIASRKVIDITNNKLKFYEYLMQNGFEMPEYYPINSFDEYQDACEKLGYPENKVCIKTIFGSGSRGVRILDEQADMYRQFIEEKPNCMTLKKSIFDSIIMNQKRLEPMMAMEYLPGAECSVDVLAENGNILYMVGRESNNVLASIPQDSILKEIPAAYEICQKVCALLKIDGNADFDFKYDKNGKPVLMEVNPRLAATMSIIAMGGVNLPYLRVKQLLREKLPQLDVNYGICFKRRYLDMFVDETGKCIEWR